MGDDFMAKIYKLEAGDLRQIVLGLCLEPKNKDAALKHMKLLRSESQPNPDHTPSQSTSWNTWPPAPDAQGNSSGRDHARRRSSANTTPYTRQKCQNCDLWFTAIDNADRACRFHPALQDGSIPSDWDSENGRKLFSHGFRWTCCGGMFKQSPACVSQYHVAVEKDTYAV
ncbi:pectate lyase a [Apiospora arundinis]